MEVFFKPSFIRDFKKLHEDVKEKVRTLCTSIFPKIKNLNDLKKYFPKKMRGFKNYYRIRIGDYRIGFKKQNSQIIFMRVLHRKDIYRHFP